MVTPVAPALVVKDAHKRFKEVQALDGAELVVEPRQMVGLLGPNGAGKTTLVRAVTGRVLLDRGSIVSFGRVFDPSAERGDLGVVPQEIAVYPQLSARENLETFGSLSGVDGKALRERVDWALAWTGLGDRADTRTKTFSGGMKRRLNIACGVMHRPRLLLLDEPTVAVDPQSREKIYDMLKALQAEGASILLTTHHLEEAEARCDRIVIIDKGKTVAAGTVAELVEKTVGAKKTVTVRLEADAPSPPTGFTAGREARCLETFVDDVARDLGPALARVAAAGHRVRDVDVRGPGLHAVFLHLTGAELRE